jgi:hypothetical protein
MNTSLSWGPTVFWLDNEEKILSDYERDCKNSFVTEKRVLQVEGIELRFEPFTSGAGLLKRLEDVESKGLADLIGIDYTLDSDDNENGVKAVEKIKSLNYPTEVIVYGGIPEENYKGLKEDLPGWYGEVNVCQNREQVMGALAAAFRKILVKWLDKEYIRGLIISRTTDVETNLDDFLIEFYQINDRLHDDFAKNVLQADLLGFGKKITLVINIVDNILENNPDWGTKLGKKWKRDFNKEIRELVDLRNKAAHGKAEMHNGEFTLTNRTTKKSYGREKLARHFHNAYDVNLKLKELNQVLEEIIKSPLKAGQPDD